MELNLSPYNFTIYRGTSAKSGKPYRAISLNDEIVFNGNLADKLIEAGTKVVDVDPLKKRK